ncbi:MAG: nickel-responsive transcriptional regulator NikR [Armatimonadota bacterium]|nr:nickel-responsive transcriptional regulator NikR [Armatimonadota bacterium]
MVTQQSALRRFSISMAEDLVAQLDAMVRAKGYRNRSHAVADMVRGQLVDYRAERGNHPIAGTITLVYDHHKRGVQALLTEIQHHHPHLIISTLHVHLDHRNCLEVLAVRGRARDVRRIADRLVATRGVKHGRLTVTTTGKEFTV